MIDARQDALHLVILGAAVFVLLSIAIVLNLPSSLADFHAMYFPAYTLLHQHDPFDKGENMRIYREDGESCAPQLWENTQEATVNVYPPSTLLLVAPLTLLPVKVADAVWTILGFVTVVLASFLIWGLSADFSPTLTGGLLALLLLSSVLVALTGNVAGIATGLAAIAVWCFVRGRFLFFGVLSLGFALALKPHDTGFVWLALVLAGSAALRRRAWQSFLASVVLSLPGILWTWMLAPHWIAEWRTNLAIYSARGGINDPGLASAGGHGLDSILSLQAVFSVIDDDPHFYNTAAVLVCLTLLLLWIGSFWRKPRTPERLWLALASLAPLSLLPIYHRQADAIVLLLAIPGCAMILSEGGWMGRASVAVSTAAFALTGFSWAGFGPVLKWLTPRALASTRGWSLLVEVFRAPLVLLLMTGFFLWCSMRRDQGRKLLPSPDGGSLGTRGAGSVPEDECFLRSVQSR